MNMCKIPACGFVRFFLATFWPFFFMRFRTVLCGTLRCRMCRFGSHSHFVGGRWVNACIGDMEGCKKSPSNALWSSQRTHRNMTRKMRPCFDFGALFCHQSKTLIYISIENIVALKRCS